MCIKLHIPFINIFILCLLGMGCGNTAVVFKYHSRIKFMRPGITVQYWTRTQLISVLCEGILHQNIIANLGPRQSASSVFSLLISSPHKPVGFHVIITLFTGWWINQPTAINLRKARIICAKQVIIWLLGMTVLKTSLCLWCKSVVSPAPLGWLLLVVLDFLGLSSSPFF